VAAVGDLHVLVLAAGASSRFGRPKQLELIYGVPMLKLIIGRAYAVAGGAVSVVVGAHATKILPFLADAAVSVEINSEWEEGLLSSIRCGVSKLPPTCKGALLLLGDQIAVSEQDLRQLVESWRSDDRCTVASRYGGGLGVPVIFPRAQFPALLALHGDGGAKALLREGSGQVIGVNMPNAEYDIDTPADLRLFESDLSITYAGHT